VKRFVIDASVTGPLVLPDETQAMIPATFDLILHAALVAPLHWRFEIANLLLIAQRRGRINDAQRFTAIERLEQMDVAIDVQSGDQAWLTSFDIAQSDGLTVYDAAYIELARRLGCGLLTYDRALAKAAIARGIETPEL
jgi:predicted nucleic acid-binding protein